MNGRSEVERREREMRSRAKEVRILGRRVAGIFEGMKELATIGSRDRKGNAF